MAPENASRNAAFRKAKEDAGIPRSQQFITHGPNTKNGVPQPGTRYIYKYKMENGIEVVDKAIRDDAAGHHYSDNPIQDRGPHFNIEGSGAGDKNHYDYNNK